MKMDPTDLIRELSMLVDPAFARGAVESYIDMQQRFLIGDWGPAELNGGRLCEAVSRAVLQIDTGKVNHSILPGKIRDILLDQKISHALTASDRNHISKAIEVVYKFRSDRGAVHISPLHLANDMDAMFVLHAGKWILAEFLRIVWTRNREQVGEVISQLVQLQHSLIHELDGRPKVLVKGIVAPDEVLLLLHHATGNQLSRSALKTYAEDQKPSTISTAISRLV